MVLCMGSNFHIMIISFSEYNVYTDIWNEILALLYWPQIYCVISFYGSTIRWPNNLEQIVENCPSGNLNPSFSKIADGYMVVLYVHSIVLHVLLDNFQILYEYFMQFLMQW